ncbi:MAG: NADP oxidoreductase [Acidimicrobiia bacterium]|nr:MAG: NADP oxidoreductase [Acidimicrobiia bacterium]
MRIAILGAGRVGRALGAGWVVRGHDVVFGVRDPSDPRHAELGAAEVPSSAARGADVLVLALPWSAVSDVLDQVETDGKIVVDATNPIGSAGPEGRSGGERVAELAPGAHVVKAFNTVGFETMADTAYRGGAPVMLVAADDPGAKQTVLGLAAELGFDAVDAGPLEAARDLERLAALWIRLARSGLGREIAFALLRR